MSSTNKTTYNWHKNKWWKTECFPPKMDKEGKDTNFKNFLEYFTGSSEKWSTKLKKKYIYIYTYTYTYIQTVKEEVNCI